MSLSTITLGTQQVTLVARPPIALREVQWEIYDPVALVASPFTGQTQAQAWPGADMMRGTMTYPKLKQHQADQVIAWLMQCRGMANAFLLGDPLQTPPPNRMLTVAGAVPAVDGSVATNNVGGATQLYTKGWVPGVVGLLPVGAWVQVGATVPIAPGSTVLTGAPRLHRLVDPLTTDAQGNGVLSIFPSLREQPADGTPLQLHNTQGVFRLAANKRTWNADVTRLSAISFPFMEYR